MNPKRTVVAVSRENFVWHSMQEIIPALEETWMRTRREGRHEVTRLDIDTTPLGEALALLLPADNIVLTCFTVKMARLAALARARLGLDARYFIHLHNQATIACWPFHVWGMGGELRTGDVFISSCHYDARAMAHAFIDARTEVVPFTFPEAGLPPVPRTDHRAADPKSADFIYIGRISTQKNLHLLLDAFALFLKGNPGFSGRLIFYGGEDNLGSPNMGLRSPPYLDELRTLARLLNLSERIHFAGHRPRAEIDRALAEKDDIFISPSLHSDENFGMAAFRALCCGRRAVLSRWGGHADFTAHFPAQVFTVDVRGDTTGGPWIDPGALSAAMASAWKAPSAAPGIPAAYRPETLAEPLLSLALEDPRPVERLRKTALAMRVLERRERFQTEDPCRIFTDYDDPDAQPFFRAYGMTTPTVESALRLSADARLRLRPWNRIGDGEIRIGDPHRGEHRLSLADASGDIRLLDLDGRECSVSPVMASRLLGQGHAGIEPPRPAR
jgi:glycosyltransferase involved in cell wall biosynthesis